MFCLLQVAVDSVRTGFQGGVMKIILLFSFAGALVACSGSRPSTVEGCIDKYAKHGATEWLVRAGAVQCNSAFREDLTKAQREHAWCMAQQVPELKANIAFRIARRTCDDAFPPPPYLPARTAPESSQAVEPWEQYAPQPDTQDAINLPAQEPASEVRLRRAEEEYQKSMQRLQDGSMETGRN